jgi:hypothetical protein
VVHLQGQLRGAGGGAGGVPLGISNPTAVSCCTAHLVQSAASPRTCSCTGAAGGWLVVVGGRVGATPGAGGYCYSCSQV